MHGKMHLICLAAGLHPDPLGELTVLARPQPLGTGNGQRISNK